MIFSAPNNKVINTTEPTVVFENGYRKVQPYFDTRTCTLKGRFFNRTLLDVLTSEFKVKSEEAHKLDIQRGKYKIYKHYKKADIQEKLLENPNFTNEISDYNEILNYKLQSNDYYTVAVHKHEPFSVEWANPEITDFESNLLCGMEILANEEDYIVIDKPGGLIVHPGASYYENSLTNILFHGTGEKYYTTFRLDKVTSGLLALGKSAAGANKFHENIKKKNVLNTIWLRLEVDFLEIL